jgi:hypothetical protein
VSKFKCNTVSVSFSAHRCSSVVFSSKVGREKKKVSGDRSVNGYLRLWLGWPLLSACCCWWCYLCRFWGELSTHLAPQALFTQSSVRELLLQALPFPSTLGEVTLCPLSQACMFIYSSHGKWVFPPSPVEFSSHCRFNKLSSS